jgi:serine/threonine protein kinase
VIHEKSFPIEPAQVLKYGAEISRGMRHLHRKGIIHRDLKSANILIGYDNNLKISDLDSHTIGTAQAATISFQGTVNWMAPELIRGDKCSQKVDTWSFGIILWELLTRQVPYDNVPSQQVMWDVGHHRLSTRIPSSCPPAIGAILVACLEFNPEERPSFDKILKMIPVAEMDMANITLEKLDEYRDEWQRESNEILEIYRNKREESVIKQSENGLLIINERNRKIERILNDVILGQENGDTEYVFNMMAQLPSSMMNQLNYQNNFSTPPMSRQGSSRRQRRSDQRKGRRRSNGVAPSNSSGLKNRGYSSDDDADREMSDNQTASKIQTAVTISRNLKYKPTAPFTPSSDSGNDVSSHSPRSSSNEVSSLEQNSQLARVYQFIFDRMSLIEGSRILYQVKKKKQFHQ